MKKLLFIVDDCVCLENFTNQVNKKETQRFIKEIDNECSTYGKTVSLSIDINDVEPSHILSLVKESFTLKNVNFIFGVNEISLIKNKELIANLLDLYAKEKKSIFIKNKDRFDLPYFVGNAGVYSFDEDEWNSVENKPVFIACSQSTVLVDVKKFYDYHGFNLISFKELLMSISKSFLTINPIQRKVLRDYFKDNLPNYDRDFLELSRNYVRLWNFGLLEPQLEKEKVREIVSRSKARIDEYTQIQDRVYNSCGMPIRFKIALNQASKQAGQGLSSAKYTQMEIEDMDSLINDLNETITEASNISSYFDGGIHINFHRVGKAKNSKELFNEIAYLVMNHNLAFFSYDFEGVEYG